MKITITILLTFCCMVGVESRAVDWPSPSGPYLGQDPPGMIPELFVPFLADTVDHKHSSPAFSADGTEMYFSLYFGGEFPQKIMVTRILDGIWTKPEVAEFSGTYQEGGPIFGPGDRRIYYYSRRPRSGETEQAAKSSTWYVDRTENGWSEPKLFAPFADILTGVNIGYVSDDGSVYAGVGSDKPRDVDLWAAHRQKDAFADPIRLPDPISRPGSFEGDCILMDNGQTMVLSSIFRYRPGSWDLFISTRKTDSTWSEPRRMGDMINSGGARFAGLSPDGKYLFFASYRTGIEELYWVDAGIVDYLKTEDLNLIDRVTQTLLTSGKEAALEQYYRFEQKYRDYYLFDAKLFGTVAEYLLDDNRFESAGWAFELNQQLFDRPRTLMQQLRLAVQSNDESEITRLYNEFDSLTNEPDGRIEDDINDLGYRLMRLGLIEAARHTLEMNTRLYPESGNAYDSYAEVLLTSGDTTIAIDNYRQSLKLAPDNENARKVLTDLGVPLE